MTARKPAKHSTDKRARLRQSAQDYQSALSWYQENLDSPNAEQDCDEATAAFKREIGHREMDIIADLLDEMDELQKRLKATMDSEPVAWINGCNKSVPAALRYLAENPRPIGGESSFNAAHLYQLAHEIESMSSVSLYHHAQSVPAWVLPEILPRSVFNVIYQQCGGFVDCEADPQAIWKACRDFMLKGGAA